MESGVVVTAAVFAELSFYKGNIVAETLPPQVATSQLDNKGFL